MSRPKKNVFAQWTGIKNLLTQLTCLPQYANRHSSSAANPVKAGNFFGPGSSAERSGPADDPS